MRVKLSPYAQWLRVRCLLATGYDAAEHDVGDQPAPECERAEHPEHARAERADVVALGDATTDAAENAVRRGTQQPITLERDGNDDGDDNHQEE